MRTRPLIAIPGRFSRSASALRFRAVVNAQALLEAVWTAGGDPVTLLPTDATTPAEITARLDGYHGVLLPGGADINPALYGAAPAPGTDPPDDLQDDFDLAVLRHALDHAMPLLTVCRGTQLLNAFLGGTLEQDMAAGHIHTVQTVTPVEPTLFGPDPIPVSCYHHQRIDILAEVLEPFARADDGTVEAVRYRTAPGWVFGVQWHPEDTAAEDPHQQLLLATFVEAARTSLPSNPVEGAPCTPTTST
ncbi:gamma-glutamyl-gamma-aminobutyrate hydrolase family protein [Streptomyces zhihengii]|uniref:Type 1 glutamine amidotransferase n=1 Tax=Streptomyces zhihengii TaxID=1818004 RepID=A0ABS2V4S0_9ACTN|nr:type 1 glutamine amidotransferase [Streptomyces zhihengii]MBM9624628.1 type 1 glutamine amidotransferase [Streptomyces zhihengii]